MSPTTADKDRVLYRTQLRDDAELRVTTSTFRGTEYVSLRNHWRNPSGDWCPTKKGVTFSVELLPEIIAALSELAGDGDANVA